MGNNALRHIWAEVHNVKFFSLNFGAKAAKIIQKYAVIIYYRFM